MKSLDYYKNVLTEAIKNNDNETRKIIREQIVCDYSFDDFCDLEISILEEMGQSTIF